MIFGSPVWTRDEPLKALVSYWNTLLYKPWQSKTNSEYWPKTNSTSFFKTAWARDVKRLEYLNNHSFVLDVARHYLDYFERKGVNTKVEVAEIFGVSRARVTQYLNVLKLPQSIIQYLEETQNNLQIRKHLTERRLRPLTCINNEEQCIDRFYNIIDKHIK